MKKGHGQKYSRKREQAIAALMTHATIERAATACSVHVGTLKRWLREPDFLADYQRARAQLQELAISQLSRYMPAAVATLGKFCLDASTEKTRLAAARSIIEYGMRGNELIQRPPQASPEDDRLPSQDEIVQSFIRSISGEPVSPPHAESIGETGANGHSNAGAADHAGPNSSDHDPLDQAM